MKKNLLILLFAFLAFSGVKSQVLLTEGFEGATFPPTGWTRINAGTGNNWQPSDGVFTDGPYTGFAKTGTKFMLCEYSAAEASNAWMITPSLAVTTGSVYNISFWYRIRSTTYPEKMKVTIGNAATVAAQTTILWDNNGAASLTSATYALATISYTATTTGNVFVGFNCYSVANQWAVFVDDITVEKVNLCSGTPTAGAASSATTYLCAPGTAVLSLTGASTSTGLTYQWQSSPAGANTFTDIPAATTVPYTATVAASTDYRCVVKCTNGNATANSTPVNVTLGSIPANDDVCAATTLTLGGASVCGNTSCATSVGDPTFSSSAANNTVWFKYTPAASGVANIVMSRPTGVTTGLINAWVGIYTATGTCPTLTLTQVTPATTGYDLTANASVTVATPPLTAGTTYYFMVDGNSGSFGAFCIQMVTPPTPPPCTTNTTPANAATNVAYLSGIALTWATTATATSYDVFFGTTNPPPATAIASNVTTNTITITGAAGSTLYYWYVVPKNNGGSATGCTSSITSFTTAAAPAAPANNDCAGAISVSSYAPVSGTTVSATESQAAEVCATFTGNANDDVWFKFKTSLAGTATITLAPVGTTFDAVMIAYSGTCGALTAIGCADGTAGGGTEVLSLTGLAANTTYYFRVYGYGAAGSEGSFNLTSAGTALPVSVTDFKGVRQGNNNLLSWTTATEINNAGFELQRSADGTNFSALSFIASKAANGNSNGTLTYAFTDTKSLTTGLYYRLKQIDKDGKSTVSSVVFIKGVKVSKLELASVYPNPAIDKLNLVVASPKADKITFMVSDLAGKVIMSQLVNVTNGDNTVQLNVSTLAKGTYTIKAVCADGCETAISKFIKQ